MAYYFLVMDNGTRITYDNFIHDIVQTGHTKRIVISKAGFVKVFIDAGSHISI